MQNWKSPEGSYLPRRISTGIFTKCRDSTDNEKVLVAQSYPTLRDPMDCSPPGSSVHGILQARIVEWVAISFSNAWKWKVKVKSLSHVRPSAIPWTAAYQAPPSMGFSRQEYWSGVPLPSPILFPSPNLLSSHLYSHYIGECEQSNLLKVS